MVLARGGATADVDAPADADRAGSVPVRQQRFLTLFTIYRRYTLEITDHIASTTAG